MSISLAQKRRGLIIAGIAVLALFFGAIVYLATVNPPWSPVEQFRGDGQGTSNAERERQEVEQAKVEAQERLEGSLRFVPQNAVIVSHANLSAVEGGQAWWNNYRHMLPPQYEIPEDLPEDLGVSSLTYATFPTESEAYSFENPFSHAIVLTTSAEKGEQTLAYISEHVSPDFYVHFTQDDANSYIILAETYAYDEIAALLQGKSETESFAVLQRAGDFAVDAPSPTMFADFSGYLGVFTAYREDKTEFINSFLSQGVGIESKTTWLGTSEDQGVTWDGTFLSGGIDRDKIDPTKFQEALNSEIEFVFAEQPGVTEGGGVFDYGYASPGLSTVGEALSVSKGNEKVGGVLNPHKVEEEAITAPEGADDEIVIVFSPQMMQASFQSALKPSSIKTVTIRAKGESASIAFDYYEDSDFDTLEGTPTTGEQPAPTN